MKTRKNSLKTALSGVISVALTAGTGAMAAPAPTMNKPGVEVLIHRALAVGKPREKVVPEEPEEKEPIHKQDDNPGRHSSGGGNGKLQNAVIPSTEGPANQQAATAIVNAIEASRDACQTLPRAYRVSCLARELKSLSEQISQDGDYEEAGEILETAARKLEKVARSNRDTTQPKMAVKRPDPVTEAVTQSKAIEAVEPAAIAAVEEAAEEIIEEAATQLLRSSEGTQERQLSYVEISQAVDSTKVLLRS